MEDSDDSLQDRLAWSEMQRLDLTERNSELEDQVTHLTGKTVDIDDVLYRNSAICRFFKGLRYHWQESTMIGLSAAAVIFAGTFAFAKISAYYTNAQQNPPAAATAEAPKKTPPTETMPDEKPTANYVVKPEVKPEETYAPREKKDTRKRKRPKAPDLEKKIEVSGTTMEHGGYVWERTRVKRGDTFVKYVVKNTRGIAEYTKDKTIKITDFDKFNELTVYFQSANGSPAGKINEGMSYWMPSRQEDKD